MSDNTAFGAFHRRLLVYANVGLFCDGYILSSIGLALITLVPHFHLSPQTTGLIGAITLLGILIGALVFGRLADKYGRRFLMIADLTVFLVATILQLFATQAWELVALRFVLGIAIGADYPIATALVAEAMPARLRGAAVNGMQVVWFAGACAAYIAGYALMSLGSESWRWILASPAVFAAIGLLLRASAPESTMWIQARLQPVQRQGFREIMRPPMIGRLAFVSAMWVLQVIPLFAIYTFAPIVLSALHVNAHTQPLGAVAITAAFLVGSIVSLPLVESWGRRPLCIAGFAVATIAFAVLATGVASLVIVTFLFYAVGIGAAAGLELTYPAELFPTAIRATATGVAAAVSRLGAFAGTFVLPIVLVRFGVINVALASAALSAFGLLISLRFAPETKGITIV